MDDAKKLKSISVKNFRACVDVKLEMPDPPMVVLIGPNMSGKSTLLDAIRMLRAAATSLSDLRDEAILRGGRQTFAREEKFPTTLTARIGTEQLDVDLAGSGLMTSIDVRHREGAAKHNGEDTPLPSVLRGALIISSPRVEPAWAATPGERNEDPRGPTFVAPVPRISERGLELANALAAIRENDETKWTDLMTDVRFAFPFVEALSFPAIAGGSHHDQVERCPARW